MDTCSSEEEVVIKTRKPYTITKQRERWTDEEHNRFLEALKLYGRAWQRIEEHIGTKTAVQIRSHAQKFFSKLEKEALIKGVLIGEALDIDIPPPRPKRKPSNPYPRKNNAATPTSQTRAKDGKLVSTSSSPCKPALDLEKEPLSEKTKGDERPTTMKENTDENQAEVYTILPAATCSSVSSATKTSSAVAESLRNSCALRLIPSVKKIVNENETNESFVTTELKHSLKLEKDDAKQAERCNGTSKPSRMGNLDPVKLSSVEKTGDLSCPYAIDDMQTSQNYPRHVPVHVLDGTLGTCTQFHSHAMPCKDCIFHPVGGVNGQPSRLPNSASSNASDCQNNRVRSTVHQSLPSYPPFTTTLNNQDYYQSFLNSSTTFSSLIVSTLLQNPAAHAAASFAATFWPYANMETSAVSPASSQGFTSRQMGCTPSIAAIAAATVAAATAWWAAHGLLPLCAPLHTPFTCAPASAAGMASVDTGQAPEAKTCEETIVDNPSFPEKLLDPEHSGAIEVQNYALKSPAISSSEYEEKTASQVIDHDKSTVIAEHNDSNKAKGRKQVDRSSCGSNTTSSSEIETDALEKNKNGKEDSKAPVDSQAAIDSSNRRGRTCSNSSDAWKEVSEEGRLAFQALFTREVLPQSFSPPQDLKEKEQDEENIQESEHTMDDKGGEASALDLTGKNCNPLQRGEVKSLPVMEHEVEDGELIVGLGQEKLKVRHTGFKPYKRCSIEARENGAGHASNQSEEKGPKRIRLGGETAT